jgi:hypothetical protein
MDLYSVNLEPFNESGHVCDHSVHAVSMERPVKVVDILRMPPHNGQITVYKIIGFRYPGANEGTSCLAFLRLDLTFSKTRAAKCHVSSMESS